MRDPTLISSSGSFPVELILLLFVLLGIIGLTIWITRYFNQQRSKPNVENQEPQGELSNPAYTPSLLLTLDHSAAEQWDILIQGKRYRTLEEVPDDTVRREVVAGLRQLAGFARGYLRSQQAATATGQAELAQEERAVVPQSAPFPPRPAPVGNTAPTSPPIQESVSGRLPIQSIAQRISAQTGTLSTQRFDEQDRLRTPNRPADLMPTIDLAREIGDIVNEMIALKPELAGRSIRLQNAPGGGINFAIDGQVYADVDHIPDPNIQALIRAATKEWERR
ncbi:MAG: hypothetical protein JXA33_01190 [Anaerolineae bacterium]|nr:hypothetical protein [Anaerolineae bacterium]